jgi:hypothetical protein
MSLRDKFGPLSHDVFLLLILLLILLPLAPRIKSKIRIKIKTSLSTGCDLIRVPLLTCGFLLRKPVSKKVGTPTGAFPAKGRTDWEPPCPDPYAGWCGTRGWLSNPQSVAGTQFAHFDAMRLGVQGLEDCFRITIDHSQEGLGWPFRFAPTLLPVLQGPNADSNDCCKSRL